MKNIHLLSILLGIGFLGTHTLSGAGSGECIKTKQEKKITAKKVNRPSLKTKFWMITGMHKM